MSFDINLIKNYFFKKDIKKAVLEPFTCIIRCATLNYLPLGTKISIINNKIHFIEPNIFQGTIRWTQGDKREDLHNIYNPIIKATQWYSKDNKDILNIFKLAKTGLEKLKKSYSECSIISHSLELYINIIDSYINDDQEYIKKLFNKKYNNNTIQNIHSTNNKNITSQHNENNTTQNDEDNNFINKSLKELWDDNQIKIINNIFIQIKKEYKINNSNDWIKSLDIILLNKEKIVFYIIEQNTTTLK